MLFPHYASAETLFLVNSLWDNGEDISRCLFLLGLVAHSHDPRHREANENRKIRKFKVILGYIVSLRPAWATLSQKTKTGAEFDTFENHQPQLCGRHHFLRKSEVNTDIVPSLATHTLCGHNVCAW